MNKADKKGKVWTFPKCAELLETSQEQTLATKLTSTFSDCTNTLPYNFRELDWRSKCYSCYQTIKKVFHFFYDIIINIRLSNDFHYFLILLMGKIELLPLLLASTISDDEKTYLTNLNIWMCYKTFPVHFQTLVVLFFLFLIKLSLKWGVSWYSFMKLDFHLRKESKKVGYLKIQFYPFFKIFIFILCHSTS